MRRRVVFSPYTRWDGKVYFEIPLTLLDREMLLGSTISETTSNWFGSVGEKPTDPLHVVFTRRDSLVSLCKVNTMYTTEVENLKERVKASTRPATLYNTGILAYTPDSTAVVIDVTDFFISDNEELTPFSPYAPILGNGRWSSKSLKRINPSWGR